MGLNYLSIIRQGQGKNIYNQLQQSNLEMKIGVFIVIFFVILVTYSLPSFPKKLFTFWHGSIDPLTKISLQSMRKASAASNWQFTIINKTTIHQYLTPQSFSKLQQLINAGSSSLSLTDLADLVRIFTLYDNGGMWMDASIFTFNNLDWVHSDSQIFIYSKSVSDPQMILVTMDTTYMGNNSIIYDEQTDQQINLVPAFENEIFITKPRCRFIHDYINRLMEFSKLEFDKEVIVAEYYGETARFNFGTEKVYHYYSDFLFQVLIQEKNRDIKMHPERYEEGYALKYYKLWCLKSEIGPYYIDNLAALQAWVISDLLGSYPLKMVEDQSKILQHSLRFIKLNQGHRQRLNTLLQNYPLNYCFGYKKRMFQKQSLLGIFLSYSQQESILTKIFNESPQQRQKICLKNEFPQMANLFSNIQYITILIAIINILIFYYALKVSKSQQKREKHQIDFSQ